MEMNLTDTIDSLLTFAIYANYYENFDDKVQAVPETSTTTSASSSWYTENIVFSIFTTILIALLESINLQ